MGYSITPHLVSKVSSHNYPIRQNRKNKSTEYLPEIQVTSLLQKLTEENIKQSYHRSDYIGLLLRNDTKLQTGAEQSDRGFVLNVLEKESAFE